MPDVGRWHRETFLLRSKVENVVMDGSRVGEFGKVGREQKLQSIVMGGVESGKEDKVKNVVVGGVKTGKVGKLANCKIDEEMWRRDCARRPQKCLARRNRESHAMLADVQEEQEPDVICFDDITGKELPWHAVRKARELESKCLRDLGES